MSYIYKQVNTSDLYHDLKSMGRDNFSYEGAKALMEYMEEVTDEPMEYDPIALCVDFSEYNESEYKSLADDYGQDFNESGEFDKESFLTWLNENTLVIEFDGGIIIQSF